MAAQVWAPNESAVAQICKLLSDFQSPTADQAQVRRRLQQRWLLATSARGAHPHAALSGVRADARRRTAPGPRCTPSAPLKQVWQQLEQARHVPDFNNYLSYIFSKGESLPSEVRAAGGAAAGWTEGRAFGGVRRCEGRCSGVRAQGCR
jgi:hypothetical protein